MKTAVHGSLVFIISLMVIVVVVLALGAAFGVTYFGFDVQTMLATALVLSVVALIVAWLLYAAIKAQFRLVRTGKEALIGAIGVAVTDLKPRGEIRVLGEFWQATVRGGEVVSGQTVEVMGLEGMFLVVRRVEEKA